MILMIGGAYQGKLDFAKEKFQIADDEIFICSDGTVDFSKRCIAGLEEFAKSCADPVAFFQAHQAQWKDSILILTDISCGVVPMDAAQRQWRNSVGRLAQYLSREADRVSRIFCGLEQRLK